MQFYFLFHHLQQCVVSSVCMQSLCQHFAIRQQVMQTCNGSANSNHHVGCSATLAAWLFEEDEVPHIFGCSMGAYQTVLGFQLEPSFLQDCRHFLFTGRRGRPVQVVCCPCCLVPRPCPGNILSHTSNSLIRVDGIDQLSHKHSQIYLCLDLLIVADASNKLGIRQSD